MRPKHTSTVTWRTPWDWSLLQASSHDNDVFSHADGVEVSKLGVKIKHPPIPLSQLTERSFRTWRVRGDGFGFNGSSAGQVDSWTSGRLDRWTAAQVDSWTGVLCRVEMYQWSWWRTRADPSCALLERSRLLGVEPAWWPGRGSPPAPKDWAPSGGWKQRERHATHPDKRSSIGWRNPTGINISAPIQEVSSVLKQLVGSIDLDLPRYII